MSITRFILGIVLCLPLQLCAQHGFFSGDYWIVPYTDESGLPVNSVIHILAGKEGQIWLSGQGGLTEFDGTHFRTWDKTLLGTRSSRIVSLGYALHDQQPFATTELNEYIRMKDQIPVYSGPAIGVLPAPAEGSIPGFRSLGRPIELYTVMSGKYIRGMGHYTMAIPVSGSEAYLLRFDSLFFFRNNSIAWSSPLPKDAYQYFMLEDQLYVWQGSLSMDCFDPSGRQKKVWIGPMTKMIWNKGEKQVFFIDRQRTLWQFLPNERFMRLVEVPNDFHPETAFCPSWGIVLLGSNTEGALLCRRKQFRVLGRGFAQNDVFYGLRPYNHTSVITSNAVLVDSRGQTTRYFRKDSPRTALHMWSLGHNRGQSYYFQTKEPKGDGAILEYDLQGNPISRYPSPRGKEVTAVSDEDDGYLWFAFGDSSVSRFDGKTFVPIFSIPGKAYCIHHYERQYLLLGTANGLFVYNKASGTRFVFPGTQNKWVRSIYRLSSGKWYAGTLGGGILALGPHGAQPLPLDPNGWLKDAHCMLEDKRGRVWISSNKGLFCVPAAMLDQAAQGAPIFYYYLGKANGFASNEFNGACQPCGVYLHNGSMVFPSVKGLVSFEPDSVHLEFPATPPRVVRLTVDGREQNMYGDTLRMEKDMERIELNVEVAYWWDRKNIRLEYNLGNTQKWMATDVDAPLVFTSLPPGYSTLGLRVRSGFGEGDYRYTYLVLYRKPKIWETIQIWPISMAILLLLGYIFMRLYTLGLQRRNRRLLEAVELGKNTIRENMHELAETNRQLQEKNRFHGWLIASVVHDIKGPLKYAVEFSQFHSGEAEADPQETRFLRSVLSTSKKIYTHSNRLIQALLLDQHLSLPAETIVPAHIIGAKVDQFQETLDKKDIRISVHIDEWHPEINPVAFDIVVHNLLDNSIKNQESGHIQLRAGHTPEGYLLEVCDEAGGLPADLLERFVRTAQTDEPVPMEKGKLGMWLIFTMVRHCKGHITFTNTPNGLCTQILWPAVQQSHQ